MEDGIWHLPQAPPRGECGVGLLDKKGPSPHLLSLLLCFRVDKSFTPRRSAW